MTLSCLLVLKEGNKDRLVCFERRAVKVALKVAWCASAGMEGLGQVVVSLLFSVLLLGHKVGVVNAIVSSVNRRKEIEEVLGQLQGSQSQLSPALVKPEHARRLTLRNDDEDTARVWQSLRAWALSCRRGAQLPFVAIGVRAGACVYLFRALMPDQIRTFTAPARLRWQVQPAPKKSIAASTGATDAHPLAVVP